MNKKLIRKMLTAAGGALRIKFTPEQIALFENQASRVPGMNNSGKNKYRKEGVLSLLYLEQEKKRKEEEIKSRMEMRPTLKRKATTSEKLQGKKDEYKQVPLVVGMSGADPLLSFYVGGVGLNGIGALAKTGLWNVAKYAPTTLLGNWGRGYFVGNTFKNSFNGTKNLSKLLAFDLFQELTSAPTSKITRLRPEFSLAMQDKDYVFGRLLWSTNLTKDGYTTSLTKHIKVMDTKQADPLIYVTQSLYPLAIENKGLRATHGGLTRPIWLNSNKPYFGTPTGVSNSTNYTYVIDASKFTPEMNLQRSIGGTHYAYPGTELLPIEGTKRILWDPVLRQYTSTIFTDASKFKLNEPGLTSLKFFERNPSRISLAERVGVPKGDRNLPFKTKLPIEHVQGDEAVKMFKEYGGEPIPEGSINGELLRKYVAEARERYGLINNKNITDEEIAQALYKHSKELGGNTAAVNSQGEPQLLFRGDTRRYTLLKEKMSPEELAKKSGTMDNSLGNLFLGEFPDSWRGVDRYIGTWRNFNGDSRLVGSGTGSKVVWDGKVSSEIEGYPYLGPLAGGGYKLYSQPHRYGNIDVYKLPASMMESGVNDLNAFIVRTPQMRDASSEISVLNDDWMLQGAKDSHFMSKNYKYNPKTYSIENVKTGKSLGEITTESAPESRVAMGDHYKELLKEAKQKLQGLLKSEANSSLRDEHSQYSYFALPNFNIQGAKHLLPYDLRKPRNWKDKNIYRGLIPLTTGYISYNLFNQPYQQLQYLKQGGKMNILEFLKNGSGIHIKKKNLGKFTKSAKAAGLSVQEHAKSVLNDPNATPLLKKRANFARNAAKWHHKQGGIIPIAKKGIKAGLHAKQNLTKRKNPDWDNLDRGYRYLTLDKGLPHDLAIALMGNVVEESQGNYKAIQKNGGGRGLIQWDGLSAPSGRYGLWGKIWASVAKPANVYDKATDTVKNYWGPYNGLKGEQVRLKFIKAPLKEKVGIYSKSYLRSGNPRNDARILSAMQLDSIYNPKIKNIVLNKEGGIIKAEEGTKTSLWNKIEKALNSNLALGIISGVGNYALYNLQNKMLNAQVDAQNALNETDYLSSWLDRYKLNLSLLNNKSNIVNQYNAYNMTPYNPPNKINYKASTPSWLNGLNIIGNSVISYYANKKPNTV